MFSLLKSKQHDSIAIEVSPLAVKVLELARDHDTYRVESYAVMPIGKEAVVEKDIIDRAAVGAAIREAVLHSKTSKKQAAISIPDSSIISKVVQVESGLREDVIESQIAIEADKFIPYSLDEVSLDFDVIGPNKKNPEYVDVLVAASKTQNVDLRSAVLEEAGLEPLIVDVESYAIERACQLIKDDLPNQGIDQTIAIVDIGSTTTTINILHNLSTIFTREEAFGGRQLTDEIQRHYGLSYSEAGLSKKTGDLPEDYEAKILSPFKEAIVLHVRRALQFFFPASEHNTVNHVLLAGCTTMIPGLAQFMQDQLGISTSIVNPIAKMKINERVDQAALNEDAPSLMLCCGLAMRGLN